MNSKSGKKLPWDHLEDTQRTGTLGNAYVASYGTTGQTYTPKSNRDLNFFKSNTKPPRNINRHSSEEQFKFRPNKMQKSPVSGTNVNNQESSSKIDLNEKMKKKSYITSTASTQYSSNYGNQPSNQQENISRNSPNQVRKNQMKIDHSPVFGGSKKQIQELQKNAPANLNSNKKLQYKLTQDTFPQIQKNTYAFLHKAYSKASSGNSPLYPTQARSKGKKSNINNRIITNSKTKQQFQIIKKLGQGKYGKVYIARQTMTGFVLAIKIVEKKSLSDESLLNQFIREIKIQAFLDHSNIIKLYSFFHDWENFYVLMELGCHGELYQIIESGKILNEESTSYISKSLLEAVKYIHSFKILHRDIKPQNIILVHGIVKICDFGWAVHKRDELRSTFCGTPLYLSPQILAGHKYDEKVDLWAIGILACQLRLGCTPFNIKQKDDLKKIVTDQVSYPKTVSNVSQDFKDFITKILMKNPKERLKSQELLNLPFIKKYQGFQTCQELCG